MSITHETYLDVGASGEAPQAERQGPRASRDVGHPVHLVW